MNGRPDPAGDPAHRMTQEGLPWLLSGTLGGAEGEAAQAHLAACAVCRADLAQLRRLRDAAAIPDPQCDPERALGRLLERIEAPGQAAPAPAAPGAPLLSTLRRAANDPRWLRRAALLQCGAIVLLAALLAWPGAAVDGYRGLGTAPAVGEQAVIVFRPETPERELRRIVRAGGARIVGGPTVTDAYVLAFPEGQAAPLLARLRAEPAVLLAEPLGSAGRP
jgi:anti-sigma factor RsiW